MNNIALVLAAWVVVWLAAAAVLLRDLVRGAREVRTWNEHVETALDNAEDPIDPAAVARIRAAVMDELAARRNQR